MEMTKKLFDMFFAMLLGIVVLHTAEIFVPKMTLAETTNNSESETKNSSLLGMVVGFLF